MQTVNYQYYNTVLGFPTIRWGCILKNATLNEITYNETTFPMCMVHCSPILWNLLTLGKDWGDHRGFTAGKNRDFEWVKNKSLNIQGEWRIMAGDLRGGVYPTPKGQPQSLVLYPICDQNSQKFIISQAVRNPGPPKGLKGNQIFQILKLTLIQHQWVCFKGCGIR